MLSQLLIKLLRDVKKHLLFVLMKIFNSQPGDHLIQLTGVFQLLTASRQQQHGQQQQQQQRDRRSPGPSLEDHGDRGLRRPLTMMMASGGLRPAAASRSRFMDSEPRSRPPAPRPHGGRGAPSISRHQSTPGHGPVIGNPFRIVVLSQR